MMRIGFTVIQVHDFICLGELYCLVGVIVFVCTAFGGSFFCLGVFLFIGEAFGLLGGVRITIQSYDLMSSLFVFAYHI